MHGPGDSRSRGVSRLATPGRGRRGRTDEQSALREPSVRLGPSKEHMKSLLSSAVSCLFAISAASCGSTATGKAVDRPTSSPATTAAAPTNPSAPTSAATTTTTTATTGSPQSIGGAATAASCAFELSDAELAARSWAFDGTVIAIADRTATFSVNQWYKGGEQDEVTVDYEQGTLSEFAPPVVAGARMLVTGEPRWGGQPLDDPVAWGCGFTQPWSSDGATQWAVVFGTSG
jgi:hypothetical protein